MFVDSIPHKKMASQFNFLEYESSTSDFENVFNVDAILDSEVPPSASVADSDAIGLEHFDLEYLCPVDNFNNINNPSSLLIQPAASQMTDETLPSKSPWHGSDSGVSILSDTISIAGSTGGMEDFVDSYSMVSLDQSTHSSENQNHCQGSIVRGQTQELSRPSSSLDQSSAYASFSRSPKRRRVSKTLKIVSSDSSDNDDSLALSSELVQNTDENPLEFFNQPSNFKAASDVNIVKVLNHSCDVNATADDIIKALDDKSKKNARQAKLNREKKKLYTQGLEKEVEHLKKENNSLRKENSEMKDEKISLLNEISYLKNILANASALSGLLKNINDVPEVKLSATIRERKRSGDNDHSYPFLEGRAAKRSRIINENLKKAGVCLHVSDGEASLEFCATCSTLSNKSHGRVV